MFILRSFHGLEQSPTEQVLSGSYSYVFNFGAIDVYQKTMGVKIGVILNASVILGLYLALISFYTTCLSRMYVVLNIFSSNCIFGLKIHVSPVQFWPEPPSRKQYSHLRMAFFDGYIINSVNNLLNSKFMTVDYNAAKKDVMPFIEDIRPLDLWSSDFFINIRKDIKTQ